MILYYELYIDVYFRINLVMDYLLLLLVRSILKCTATHLRMLLGGLTGAPARVPSDWQAYIDVWDITRMHGKNRASTEGEEAHGERNCALLSGLLFNRGRLPVAVRAYLIQNRIQDLSVFFSGQLCTDPGRNGSLPAFYGQKWKYLSGSAVLEGKMLSHHGVTGYGKQLKRPCQE